MNKKYRSISGITLVALVVTIIVLLILAGVTFSLLMGDNGVINRAIYAKNTVKKQENIEKIKLAALASQDEYEKINLENFKNEIEKNNGITVNGNTLPLIIETSDGIYKLKENGEVKEKIEGVFEPEDVNEENALSFIGCKIEGYSAGGIQSWRILYADNENFYIRADLPISVDQAPRPTTNPQEVAVFEKSSTDKWSMSLSNIVNRNLYSGSEWLLEEGNVDKNVLKWLNDYFQEDNDVNKTNSRYAMKKTCYLLDSKAWSSKFENSKALYTIGAPTVELIAAVNNLSIPDSKITYNVKNGGYSITQQMKKLYSSNEKGFFAQSTIGKSDSFVASPYYMFQSDELYYIDKACRIQDVGGDFCSIYPVVCLKKDVNIELIGKDIYDINIYKIK